MLCTSSKELLAFNRPFRSLLSSMNWIELEVVGDFTSRGVFVLVKSARRHLVSEWVRANVSSRDNVAVAQIFFIFFTYQTRASAGPSRRGHFQAQTNNILQEIRGVSAPACDYHKTARTVLCSSLLAVFTKRSKLLRKERSWTPRWWLEKCIKAMAKALMILAFALPDTGTHVVI